MQFIVTDRESLERGIVVKVPYVVVSIRDSNRRQPRIRRGSGLRGVHAIAFDDVEPAAGQELPSDLRLMTEDDAVDIWRFVERHRSEIDAVVCQCEEGMSRGPAIAAALAEALGGDADEILAAADINTHVYKLMTAAITSARLYGGQFGPPTTVSATRP
jgi:predicted protein tyrosine phosphatase